MKIAVTYENGEVFQHFGHTEQFKVYEVENGKVISSEILGGNGAGHSALAALLADKAVNVLICGGLGGGAEFCGISIVSALARAIAKHVLGIGEGGGAL